MTPDVRRTISELWWPGYTGSGTPDVAARHAEAGTDFDCWATEGPDEWDWQRYEPMTLLDGSTHVVEQPRACRPLGAWSGETT